MCALYQENEITSDTFSEDGLDLSVAKSLNVDLTRLSAERSAYVGGKFLRTCTGKNFYRWLHSQFVREDNISLLIGWSHYKKTCSYSFTSMKQLNS